MARELIYTAEIGITGTFPMLMHKCGTMEKTVKNSTTDYSEEWVSTVYLGMQEKVAVYPSMNIDAMFKDASKGQKIGKNFMTKVVPTGVVINEFEIPVLDPRGNKVTIEDIRNNEWTFTCQAVVNKKRINRTRAMFPVGWMMNWTISVYSPLLKPEIVRDLLDRAGYEVGIGDWRPAKSGKFGQFELSKFEVQ